MGTFAIIAFIILFAILCRLIAGGMDGDRVEDYIHRQGGELIDLRWSPFGSGWLGKKNDRIYELRYRDRFGKIHEATVKTPLFSGVYCTEDTVVEPGDSVSPDVTDLERKNARLRQQIAELENRQPS